VVDLRLALGVLAGIAVGLACRSSQVFECRADGECVIDAIRGRCEFEGVCSFPDGGCPSGRRFGELSGEVAGECVDLPGATGGTTDGGGVTGTGGSRGTETSKGSDGTSTGEASSTGSLGTSSGTGGSSSGGGPTGDPYGQCETPNDCPGMDPMCIPLGMTSGCTVSCNDPAEPSMECPESVDGSGTPTCAEAGLMVPVCVLSCVDDMDCPDGMVCVDFMGPSYCLWN